MSLMLIVLVLSRVPEAKESPVRARQLDRMKRMLEFVDAELAGRAYFAGAEFTAADVMMVSRSRRCAASSTTTSRRTRTSPRTSSASRRGPPIARRWRSPGRCRDHRRTLASAFDSASIFVKANNASGAPPRTAVSDKAHVAARRQFRSRCDGFRHQDRMRDLYSYSLIARPVRATRRGATRPRGRRAHAHALAGRDRGRPVRAVARRARGESVHRRAAAGDRSASRSGALAAFAAVCAFLAVFARHSGVQLLLRRSTFAQGPWKLGVDDDGLWLAGPARRVVHALVGLEVGRGAPRARVAVPRRRARPSDSVRRVRDRPRSGASSSTHVRAKIAAQPGRDARAGRARGPRAAAAGRALRPIHFAPDFRTLLETAVQIATFRPHRAEPARGHLGADPGPRPRHARPAVRLLARNRRRRGHLAWTLPARRSSSTCR